MLLLFVALIGLVFVLLNGVPKSYPPPANPLAPPTPAHYAPFELDGFESPYLGHTGSWDGKGGNMWGRSKVSDLDKEIEMGLRWTFMPVNWSTMESEGPADLSQEVPAAWQALDEFVIEAQKRGLNILMQAPVVGGNAGGPPDWAGRREKGKSAPLKMGALVEFAGKLAQRYRPGGTLATEQGWGYRYGVRVWELDNEPEMYRTHWKGQAADYAEFVTLAAARIKAMDPKAVIVAPGLSAGKHGLSWLEAALDPTAMAGSPVFRAQGKPYSVGPAVDVVSYHNYEGLDSALSGESRTVSQVLENVRAVFEKWEQRAPGFTYLCKLEYWRRPSSSLIASRRWRGQTIVLTLFKGWLGVPIGQNYGLTLSTVGVIAPRWRAVTVATPLRRSNMPRLSRFVNMVASPIPRSFGGSSHSCRPSRDGLKTTDERRWRPMRCQTRLWLRPLQSADPNHDHPASRRSTERIPAG